MPTAWITCEPFASAEGAPVEALAGAGEALTGADAAEPFGGAAGALAGAVAPHAEPAIAKAESAAILAM
jgi:hypothetical protein